MQHIAFSHVPTRLADALRQMETVGEPVAIVHGGQTLGVLMSVQEFQLRAGLPSDFLTRLNTWRDRYLESRDRHDSVESDSPWADVRMLP